ncbi:hypothetical protein ACLB2K_004824 [Fragaria x ananassa]
MQAPCLLFTASSVTVLAPAPKKKRGLCSGKKADDIVAQTRQKIKLEYCPCVKGPSVRGINSLVAHDIGSAIRSLVGMRARTFYDLDQEEKWKVWNAMSPKYEWDENDEPMFNWILKRAHERDSPWQTSGTVGRRLCTTTRGLLLSSTQWKNSEYKGSSFQLSRVLRRPMSGQNDMVDEINKLKDAFKEQHPDATEEEIMESVQSQQIEVWVRCSKLGKERRSDGWDEEASET